MEKKRIRKNSPLVTAIFIILIVGFIGLGILAITYNMGKLDKAIQYSEKILNLYIGK